jgi:hypothetical protein
MKISTFASPNREVSEWLKEHAWKVCKSGKRFEGSNPFLSAKISISIFFNLFGVVFSFKCRVDELALEN